MNFQRKIFLSALFVLTLLGGTAFAQQVQIPRASPRAEVAQVVGDTKMMVVYHRPSVNNRAVWGCQTNDVVQKPYVTYPCLVPNGQVWRTGANENTTFEVSENVRVNGQGLPAGKYGLHTIPGKDEWTIIFSKKNDDWGSFAYKPENDALRAKTKPEMMSNSRETMLIAFDATTPTTAKAVIEWEKLRVPFTVEVVGVQDRVLAKLRQQVAGATDVSKPQPYLGARLTAANFVIDNKIKSAYSDAGVWIDESIKARETFGSLRAKARLAAEMGNYEDAVMYGDKAVAAGKTAQPAVNADFLATFEKELSGWKTKN